MRFRRAVESGEQTVVGVNRYNVEEDASARPALAKPDPARMRAHLEAFRAAKASPLRRRRGAHSTRLPALQTIRARMCSARWWRPPKPGARMARSAGRCVGSSGSDGRWWLYERPQRKGAKRCEKEGETVSRAQPGCGRIWSPLEATRRRLLASWRRDGSPMSISALPAFASCAALR